MSSESGLGGRVLVDTGPFYAMVNPDQTISFFDALLAEMASVLELPVWTYDSDFDVMGVAVWR